MIAALNFSPFPLYLAERDEPTRKHAPLVIVEDEHVVHANASARKQGITPSMRLAGARMRTGNLAVASYTEPDLQHAWTTILRELHGYTPWLEAPTRGRAFAHVSAAEGQQLAQHYGVPVGLADDLETAELASLTAAPGHVREVMQADTPAFLRRLPLHFLKHVGLSVANLTRLHWLGLSTVGDLASWSAPQIRSYLGAEGAALLPSLHGPRRTKLRTYEQPETVRRSLTFTEPVLEPRDLHAALSRLASSLEDALRGRAARHVTLTAATPGGERRASRLAKRPMTRAPGIFQQALYALSDSQAEGQPVQGLALELTSPTLTSRQESLWPQRERRQRALRATMERYPAAQRRFAWRDPHAQSADLAWQWESYAAEGGAYATADTASRSASGPLGKPRRRTPAHAAPPTAVAAAAVPLFDPADLTHLPLGLPSPDSAGQRETTQEPPSDGPWTAPATVTGPPLDERTSLPDGDWNTRRSNSGTIANR